MIDVHQCPKCNHLHGRSISVDGLLVEKGMILLIKRGNHPYKGYWALPGGYVDFDETAAKACVREFKEETGIIVGIETLLGLFSDPKRHKLQNISAAYIVRRISSGRGKAGDDAIKVNWFSLDKLPEEIAFDHKKMIRSYQTTKHDIC